MDEYYFLKKAGGGVYRSNALWIRQAHKIFKKTLATGTLKEANLKTLEYIWRFYEARPASKLIVNGKNYWLNAATRSFAFIMFNQQSENNGKWWEIAYKFPPPNAPYYIYVSTESNWYKKRHSNIMRHFPVPKTIKLKEKIFSSPILELAQLKIDRQVNGVNEDFTKCWLMDENLRVDKKIDDNDSFLKTNNFFGNTHNKKVSEHELKKINNYKLDNTVFRVMALRT